MLGRQCDQTRDEAINPLEEARRSVSGKRLLSILWDSQNYVPSTPLTLNREEGRRTTTTDLQELRSNRLMEIFEESDPEVDPGHVDRNRASMSPSCQWASVAVPASSRHATGLSRPMVKGENLNDHDRVGQHIQLYSVVCTGECATVGNEGEGHNSVG